MVSQRQVRGVGVVSAKLGGNRRRNSKVFGGIREIEGGSADFQAENTQALEQGVIRLYRLFFRIARCGVPKHFSYAEPGNMNPFARITAFFAPPISTSDVARRDINARVTAGGVSTFPRCAFFDILARHNFPSIASANLLCSELILPASEKPASLLPRLSRKSRRRRD